MYKLELSKRAQKQIKKLDKSIQRLIIAWIEKNIANTDNPRQHGKGLTGDRSNEWRYRIGSYRLICDIRDEELLILALEVGHRKEIYKAR
ncbi:type II toxin-antitoxin system RelE family toxin [Streptococcus oricebi]|uniref:Type II toxin-antitoxin system RelE/ParE family toxin n=1 Tax=Streptococcus oricebi TaxID=1547447 RepID=A0ABS5B2G0_9STRE|nr:type II toxin-antitoxin system RelE/ParE family toxin [Streptococcus oricebi]MBP2623018.1 type II toxin-antitoxin system RelE/ParE family toxin [Streptococcus oricebi]